MHRCKNLVLPRRRYGNLGRGQDTIEQLPHLHLKGRSQSAATSSPAISRSHSALQSSSEASSIDATSASFRVFHRAG